MLVSSIRGRRRGCWWLARWCSPRARSANATILAGLLTEPVQQSYSDTSNRQRPADAMALFCQGFK